MRDQVLIGFTCVLVFFLGLGATELWDLDEPLYASCAREMLAVGDWVVPRFNGELFFDKPPLMFWLMMSGFALFGQSEFAARFWSPVMGIATALLTYHLGRRLLSRRTGFWAGLAMSSNVIFTVSARAATVDAALTLCVTAAVWCLVKAWPERFPEPDAGSPVSPKLDRSRPRPHAEREEYGSPVSPKLDRLPPRPHAEREEYGSPLLRPLSSRPAGGSYRARRWLWLMAMYALCGVAVLAKGPIGLLLPCATLGLFLLWSGRWSEPTVRPCDSIAESPPQRAGWRAWLRELTIGPLAPGNVWRAIRQMHLPSGLLVAAAVALPWYVLVGLRTDGLWLQQFFAKYNVGPFVQPFMGHHGPWFYHLLMIFVGLFPWSIFLGPTLVNVVRNLGARATGSAREEPSTGRASGTQSSTGKASGTQGSTGRASGTQAAQLLLLAWIAVWFGFWSICSTKLPHYVLPAYPAVALWIGMFLADWERSAAVVARWWMPLATACLAIAGLGLAVAVPLVAARYVPGEANVGLIGIVIVAGAALCARLLWRGERLKYLAAFASMAVFFVTALFTFAAQRIDSHQHSAALVSAVFKESAGPQLASFRYQQASLIYYAGGRVPRYDDVEQLRRFFETADQPYVFTTEAHCKELEQRLGRRLEVVARRTKFLGTEEVRVLGRRELDPVSVAGRIASDRY